MSANAGNNNFNTVLNQRLRQANVIGFLSGWCSSL